MVAVILSFAAAAVLAATFLLFCDSGPVSRCFLMGAAVIGIAIVQLLLLVTGWVLLKRGERIRSSAAFLFLSVAPLVAGAVFFLIAG